MLSIPYFTCGYASAYPAWSIPSIPGSAAYALGIINVNNSKGGGNDDDDSLYSYIDTVTSLLTAALHTGSGLTWSTFDNKASQLDKADSVSWVTEQKCVLTRIEFQLNNSRPRHVFGYLKFIARNMFPHWITEKYKTALLLMLNHKSLEN